MQRHFRRRLFGGATAAACGLLVAFSAMADHPDKVLPDFTIPSAVDPAVVADVQFSDYVHVKHGLGTAGSVARSSEFGHENYRDGELSGDFMRSMGETWLSMVRDITETFWDYDGTIAPGLELSEIGLVPAGGMRLQDYSNAAFAYQVHHRGPRWRGEGHEDITDAMTKDPQILAYFTSIGRHVLDHHYVDGRIVHTHMDDDHPGHAGHAAESADRDSADFDAASMSFGLAAVHAPIYAYVRRASPEGEGDMGQVEEAQLAAWLGYSIDEIVAISREIAGVLDEHWDADVGAYDFGEGARYELTELGALMTGHKGLYEALAVFGDDNDRQLATTLAERAATMLRPIVVSQHIGRDWGLPTRVEFTAQGVQAASGTVSVADQWEFVTRVNGGFGIPRERESEGSGLLMNEVAPDVLEAMREFNGRLVTGALDHQVDDQGFVVSELDYFTGEVTNPLYTPAAIGSFLTGAGNVYRAASVRPSEWDAEDEETRARSIRFHDLYVQNAEFLRSAFLVQRTW